MAATADTHGTVTLVTGSITYTPAFNFNGTSSFTYTVSDDEGLTDSETVTITVIPVNDAPVISADPDPQTVQYSDPVAGVTLTGTDVDSLSLTIITTEWTKDGGTAQAGLPAGLSLSAANCVAGAPPVSCTWAVTGNIQEGPGAYDVTVSLLDDGELTDTTQLGASTTFSDHGGAGGCPQLLQPDHPWCGLPVSTTGPRR